jgi:hypothetical protein
MTKSLTYELLMMSGLNCATLMRARPKLNLLIRICTIDNIRRFLKNLKSPWMIALLDLILLLVAYVLVVLLNILIMNVLSSCCMLLIILSGA